MASSLTHSQTQIPNSGLQGPAWCGLRDSLAHVSHHSSHLLGSVLWFLPILVHNKGPPKDLCSCCCLCLKHLSPKQAYNSLPLFFQSLPKCNHSLWSSSASALTLCPLTLLYDFHRPYHIILFCYTIGFLPQIHFVGIKEDRNKIFQDSENILK